MQKWSNFAVAFVSTLVALLVPFSAAHAQAPPPDVSDTVELKFSDPIPLPAGSVFEFQNGIARSSSDRHYSGKVTCKITSDKQTQEACVKHLTQGTGTVMDIPGFGLMVFGSMTIGESAHDQRANAPETITFGYQIFVNAGVMAGAGDESDNEGHLKNGSAGVLGQPILNRRPDGGLELAGLTFTVYEQHHVE